MQSDDTVAVPDVTHISHTTILHNLSTQQSGFSILTIMSKSKKIVARCLNDYPSS